jgi:hypothetical protein
VERDVLPPGGRDGLGETMEIGTPRDPVVGDGVQARQRRSY